MSKNGRSALLTWVAAALPILLILLGSLQYRWIGEVSRAERDRLQASLDRSARIFASEFDREISQAWITFQYDNTGSRRGGTRRSREHPPGRRRDEAVDPHTVLRERYGRWLAVTSHPDLIQSIYLADSSNDQAPALEQMTLDQQSFAQVPWPASLEPVRSLIEEGPGPSPGSMSPVVATVPALLTSLASFRPGERERRTRLPHQVVILVLDRAYLTDELLPLLLEHSFGAQESLQYDLQIVERATGRVIYSHGPRGQTFSEPDAAIEFFVPRPFGRFRDEGGPPSRAQDLAQPPPSFVPGAWELQLQHRAGSLEAVVGRTRQRNLLLSIGILGLLAAAVSLLVASARRSQHLAQQQLEFVAGITHELNTPLAAIRSAGQNLADGVVLERRKVERYGSMIVKEGQRLSTLVDQALDFAGLKGGTRTESLLQPLEIRQVVEAAFDNSEWLRQETGASVELDLPADLPPVLGDRSALVRVFDNLLTNALKYGGRPDQPSQVRIGARETGPSSLEVTVEDRGPGIPSTEVGHVLEPFFRGSAARNGTIAGSGLGLALVRHIVEQHGGKVRITSSEAGTSVTVSLQADTGNG